MTIRNKEIILSLHADGIIVYIENPTEFKNNYKKIVSELSKFRRYKANIKTIT